MINYKFYVLILLSSVLIKFLAINFTNFDLFGDEAQYWIWSQNLDFGYYSKPPMLSWLISAYTLAFGNEFVSLKYIPIIIYFFTSYAVYLIAYELYEEKELSLIVAFSFYLLPSVSVSSFLISTDVVLIFFCSLFMLVLIRIRKKPSFINFIILGIFLGLSFLAKYAATYYIFSLFLLLLLDKKTRFVFFEKYLNIIFFLGSFVLLILPNIIWNHQNEWITIFHTSDNAGLKRAGLNLLHGLEFLGTQWLMLGPITFLFFVFYLRKIKINFETKFLLIFSLPVFVIVLVESILVRANANWAAVALIPFFIITIEHVYRYSKKTIIIGNFFNFGFCFIFFILIATSSNLSLFNRINGISHFAKNLEENYLGKTDFLVVQDRILYSNLKYLFREENISILTPYNPANKIKSHFQLSNPLKPTHNKNFIFLGNPISIDYLEKKFSFQNINLTTKKNKFINYQIEMYEVSF